MPKYVIERNIPGAGKLTPQELQAISQKSCAVLGAMGPELDRHALTRQLGARRQRRTAPAWVGTAQAGDREPLRLRWREETE